MVQPLLISFHISPSADVQDSKKLWWWEEDGRQEVRLSNLLSSLREELTRESSYNMCDRREFYIVSEMNGKVLDIAGANSCPGALVQVWGKSCHRLKNQLWYRDSCGFIHSALNDLVPESHCGAQLKMAHLSCDGSQQWSVECNKIVNKKGECLDIKQSDCKDGAPVIGYTYYNTSNQHWRLEYV